MILDASGKLWNYMVRGVYNLDIPVKIPGFRKLKVLDVGSGYNPRLIADVMVNNVDVYEGKRTVTSRGRYYKSDIENLPFQNKSFDVAIANHVFEHLKQPHIAFREMNRVAKTVLIITPSAFREARGTDLDHYWFVFGERGKYIFEAIPPGFKGNPELRHEKLERYSLIVNELAIGEETVYYQKADDNALIEIRGAMDEARFLTNQEKYQQISQNNSVESTTSSKRNRLIFIVKSIVRRVIHLTRPKLDPKQYLLSE